MSISTAEQKRYFHETAIVLRREGFRVEPSIGGRLSVWLDDHPLCEVDQIGGITYRSDNILTPEHRAAKSSWEIMTEEERFGPKLAEGLPELCYSVHESTGELIVIKRGECGYHATDYSTPDKERNVELADHLNDKLGVDIWQRQAMEVGSICGWDVPGADPAKYLEPNAPQLGGMTLG